MKLCLGKSRVDFDLGKIKPPSSPAGCFTQILSVGIGGSALGPPKVVMSAFDPELSERHYKKALSGLKTLEEDLIAGDDMNDIVPLPNLEVFPKCCYCFHVLPDFKKYTHYSDLTRKVFLKYDPYFVSSGLDEAYLDITESQRKGYRRCRDPGMVVLVDCDVFMVFAFYDVFTIISVDIG
ncbi:hypothetical protein Syun_010296 [Stephania yunnanensis]|uniref:Uncharacterized protein n=1 Tax=Stephania yunnanensis TaxID=152371 RepID=A0AAP0PPV2_9MAGN